MSVHVITVAYGLPMGTIHVVQTALQAGCKVHLFLHSQQPAVVDACQTLAELDGVTAYLYGQNRGLARSWNEGLIHAFAQGAETAITINDDYTFTPQGLTCLADMALQHPERYAVTAYGAVDVWGRIAPIGVAFQAFNPLAMDVLGCFDRNYFPIYYEDIDYQRRATLLGLEALICYDMQVGRLSSVSTVDSLPALNTQNGLTMSLNRAYHLKKWGGDRGEETYLHPFNDPAIPLRIAPEVALAPYAPFGEYDRQDHQVVQL